LGKATINETLSGSSSVTVALEPGTWTLEVRGYADALHTDLKLSGTTSVAITPGTLANFDVYLTPDFVSGATGSLDYSVTFPSSVRVFLGLYPMDDTPGTSHEIDLSLSPNGTIPNIPEGVYQAVIDLYDSANNRAAGRTEAVHIYGGLATPLTRGFTTANFAACPPVVGDGLTSLAAKLDAALASPAGSYTIVLEGTESDLASFTPKTLNVTGKNINITIRGNAATVQVNNLIASSHFTLGAASGSNLSLELRDLTLRGLAANSVPVVQVNSGGILLMKAGSLITGNTSSSNGGGVYVNYGTFTMSGGAVSNNSSSDYGGGVRVSGGTFTMSGGTVSGNFSSGSGGVYVENGTFTMSGGAVCNNSSYYSSGGGVYVSNSGTFTMSGGTVSGNSSSSDYGGGVYISYGTFTMSGGAVSGNSSSYGGGGVYLYNGGTFTMSGGAVSGNSSYSSSYYSSGGGVYVYGGTFTMSGGAVNSNTLSGTNSYGREVLVSGGTFKISGDAWPERVFLNGNARFITISGVLSGPVTPIDLGVTSTAPLANYVDQSILRLDTSYSSGDMANLKTYFSLGNSKLTESPYTEEAITGYEISDNGIFVAE
jgi:hypothetical protein